MLNSEWGSNATMICGHVAFCVPHPKLDRPTKDGGTLRTIREACDYMTGIGKKRELRQRWQWAAKLILAQADVVTVSRALELALFYDAKLDVSKVPAK